MSNPLPLSNAPPPSDVEVLNFFIEPAASNAPPVNEPTSDAPGDTPDPQVNDPWLFMVPTYARERTRAARIAFLASLEAGKTVEQAADDADISHKRAYRWLTTSPIKEALASKMSAGLDQYLRQIVSTSVRSVNVLAEAQQDEDVEVRIKAASRLLTSVDRALDRAKGSIDAAQSGPLIVFPPGTRIAVLAQTPAAGVSSSAHEYPISDSPEKFLESPPHQP